MRFKLLESKQTEKLFHFCDIYQINQIIKQNKISTSNYSGISFTRNPSTTFTFSGMPNEAFFRIVVDKTKLSNDYNIVPYTDALDLSDGNTYYRTSEEEERVISPCIDNISDYIEYIDIILDRIPNYFDFNTNVYEQAIKELATKYTMRIFYKDKEVPMIDLNYPEDIWSYKYEI